ncbi:hypothetical protein [Vibrio sp. 10N.261.51.F12]|uniref:hypothetical protein n=1 Tax=Vibrio sp. 10N.261.51.F12 TaxID=3229679 RepID=UPI003552448A
MKLKLISTLIAASFLAGCSSNGSSNDGDTGPAPQDGIAEVTTYEGDIFNAALIQGDEGEHNAFVAVDNEGSGYIHLNGETYFVDNGDVTDKNGDAVGSVQGQDGGYIFHGNNGGEITLTNVDGRLVISGYQPPRPELPILPAHPIFDDHDYTITETKSGYIIQGKAGNSAFVGKDGNIYDTNTSEIIGSVYQIKTGFVLVDNNGQSVATWDKSNGLTFIDRDEDIDRGIVPIEHPIFDGYNVTITETKSGYLIQGDAGNSAVVGKNGNIYDTNTSEVIGKVNKTNTGYVIANSDGKTVASYDSNNGLRIIETDASIDRGITPIKNPTENELRDSFAESLRNLSQEQRQQIKQTVKDRVNRS